MLYSPFENSREYKIRLIQTLPTRQESILQVEKDMRSLQHPTPRPQASCGSNSSLPPQESPIASPGLLLTTCIFFS